MEGETARFRYTFQRMKQTAQTVVDSVCGELAVSDFTPAYFELGFGRGQAMPPLEVEKGVRLRLTGFVDRVDSWVKDGRRYLRVVDYKTGRKSFDFSDVADGRGLRCCCTCSPCAGRGSLCSGPEELVPAGVLYVPARSPIVNGERAMTDEDIAAARQRELRRKGLVLDSQEVLDAMEHADGGYRYLPIPSSGRGKDDYLVSLDKLDQLDDYLDRGAGGGGGAAVPGQHRRGPLLARRREERLPLLRLRRGLPFLRSAAATRSAAGGPCPPGSFGRF